MSVSNIYANGGKAPFKDLYVDDLNCADMNATSLTATDVTAINMDTTDITCTGLTLGTATFSSKEDRLISNSFPLTLTVTDRQGFIRITNDAGFPAGAAVSITMTGPFVATDMVLVSLGVNTDSGGNSGLQVTNLSVGVKTVSAGQLVVTFANHGAAPYAGTEFSFSYLAV